MHALEIQSLSKRFGRVHAVRDVSLVVEHGQIYGLLGPNGSGKTTTLACALGLLRPDSGNVRILGEAGARIARTKGRVAAVFDRSTLVPRLSVLRNLNYARSLLGHTGGRNATDCLRMVGLEQHSKQRADRLSLGQSRRLSIARALLGKPELLVFDEPLSGLDTLGVLEMLELFKDLHSQGLTLLLSSHRLHEMERIVTHAGVVQGGKVLRSEPLSQLLGRSKNPYRLRAEPLDLVSRSLEAVPDLGAIRQGTDGQLEIDLGRLNPSDIVKTLVQAGCAVSEFAPKVESLQSVFESLLKNEGARS